MVLWVKWVTPFAIDKRSQIKFLWALCEWVCSMGGIVFFNTRFSLRIIGKWKLKSPKEWRHAAGLMPNHKRIRSDCSRKRKKSSLNEAFVTHRSRSCLSSVWKSIFVFNPSYFPTGGELSLENALVKLTVNELIN